MGPGRGLGVRCGSSSSLWTSVRPGAADAGDTRRAVGVVSVVVVGDSGRDSCGMGDFGRRACACSKGEVAPLAERRRAAASSAIVFCRLAGIPLTRRVCTTAGDSVTTGWMPSEDGMETCAECVGVSTGASGRAGAKFSLDGLALCLMLGAPEYEDALPKEMSEMPLLVAYDAEVTRELAGERWWKDGVDGDGDARSEAVVVGVRAMGDSVRSTTDEEEGMVRVSRVRVCLGTDIDFSSVDTLWAFPWSLGPAED